MRKAQVDPFLISSAALSAPSLLWDYRKAYVDVKGQGQFTDLWHMRALFLHVSVHKVYITCLRKVSLHVHLSKRQMHKCN